MKQVEWQGQKKKRNETQVPMWYLTEKYSNGQGWIIVEVTQESFCLPHE
jgi:hypothetical protein